MYFTAYHSWSGEVFERTNQTLKIALRSLILTIDSKNWSSLVDSLQKEFNNYFISAKRSFNEICYNFISLTTSTLVTINTTLTNNINSILSRLQMKNNIAYEQMLAKLYYDKNHALINFNENDWVLLRLHKDYNIFSIVVFDFKFSQQYTEFFRILEKINNLVYKLNISQIWRVHFVFSVA